MLERPAIDSGLGRRGLNESWCVVKCTYLLLSGGRTGPDGQATNSHHESLPAMCWMRCLQRRATSSGTVGPGTPQQPWATLFNAWASSPLESFFLHLTIISCTSIHACGLSPSLGTCVFPAAPPKTPRAPHFLGETFLGKASNGVCSPSQLSEGWAHSREQGNTRYPHTDL